MNALFLTFDEPSSPLNFEANDLAMASFTHGKITNFHPAKIISTVLNRGGLDIESDF